MMFSETDDHDEDADDDHDEDADDDGCVQTHYGCTLRHKNPEADPQQKMRHKPSRSEGRSHVQVC